MTSYLYMLYVLQSAASNIVNPYAMCDCNPPRQVILIVHACMWAMSPRPVLINPYIAVCDLYCRPDIDCLSCVRMWGCNRRIQILIVRMCYVYDCNRRVRSIDYPYVLCMI
jgi:hypothetical protein